MRQTNTENPDITHISINTDHDGCLALSEPIKTFPEPMEKIIIGLLQKYPEAQVSFRVASFRQTLLLNALGVFTNKNGCCVKTLQECVNTFTAEHPEYKDRITINELLLEDISQKQPPGTHFQQALKLIPQAHRQMVYKHQDENFCLIPWHDSYKKALLYTHTHHDANLTPADKHLYVFFDDREDILSTLGQMNPLFFPYNTTVMLYEHMAGQKDTGTLKTTIQGTGPIDNRYESHVRLLDFKPMAFIWHRNAMMDRKKILTQKDHTENRHLLLNQVSMEVILDYVKRLPPDESNAIKQALLFHSIIVDHEVNLHKLLQAGVRLHPQQQLTTLHTLGYIDALLQVAVRNDDLTAIPDLLTHDPNLSAESPIDEESVLRWAAKNKRWATVEALQLHPNLYRFGYDINFIIPRAIADKQMDLAFKLMPYVDDHSNPPNWKIKTNTWTIHLTAYLIEYHPDSPLLECTLKKFTLEYLKKQKVLPELLLYCQQNSFEEICNIAAHFDNPYPLVSAALQKNNPSLTDKLCQLVHQKRQRRIEKHGIIVIVEDWLCGICDTETAMAVWKYYQVSESSRHQLVTLLNFMKKQQLPRLHDIKCFLPEHEVGQAFAVLLPKMSANPSSDLTTAFFLLFWQVTQLCKDTEIFWPTFALVRHTLITLELSAAYREFKDKFKADDTRLLYQKLDTLQTIIDPNQPLHTLSPDQVCDRITSFNPRLKRQPNLIEIVHQCMQEQEMKMRMRAMIQARIQATVDEEVKTLFKNMSDTLNKHEIKSEADISIIIEQWLVVQHTQKFTREQFLKKLDSCRFFCSPSTDHFLFVKNLPKEIYTPRRSPSTEPLAA